MRFTEIDIPTTIKIGEYYNKKIPLTFNDSKPIRFQIPRMYMPFGLSGFTPEIGQTKWNVDFSMSGWNEDNNYINKFYEFLKSLEAYILKNVNENRLEIFGTASNIENLFNSNIKENPGHDPKFRIKVDVDNVNFIKPKIFDVQEKNITCEASKGLYKGYTGVSLVELHSVYFLNKKFGLTWKMCQMKVYEPQRLRGFQFIENNEEEPDEEVKIEGFQFKI